MQCVALAGALLRSTRLLNEAVARGALGRWLLRPKFSLNVFIEFNHLRPNCELSIPVDRLNIKTNCLRWPTGAVLRAPTLPLKLL